MLSCLLQRRVYLFRQRAQWEKFLAEPCKSITDLVGGINKIENSITTTEDRVLFANCIKKHKSGFRQLFSVDQVLHKKQYLPSLQPSLANILALELSNLAVEQAKDRLNNFKVKKVESQIQVADQHFQLILQTITSLEPLSNTYFSRLLPSYEPNTKLINEYRRRFSLVEQMLCTRLFKSYSSFNYPENNTAKVTYRQDFKFELSNYALSVLKHVQSLDKLVSCFYVFAKHNFGSPKLYLLAELLLTQMISEGHTSSISYPPAMVDKILFTLAHANRGIKTKQSQLVDLILNNYELGRGYGLGGCYYVAVNRITDFRLFSTVSQLLSRIHPEQLDECEFLAYKCILTYFKQTEPGVFTSLAQVTQRDTSNSQMGTQEAVWNKFLHKKNYEFTARPCSDGILGETLYKLDPDSFVYINYKHVIFRDNTTGLVSLAKDYYKLINRKTFLIYSYQTSGHTKKNQTYAYFESRLKNQRRNYVQKPLTFEY